MKRVRIETARLILRPLQKHDEDSLFVNINDLEICRGLKDVKYPFTKKDAKSWIVFNKKMWASKRYGRTIPFAIILKNENKVIGGVSLNNYDKNNNRAEIGYWIGKKYWGKGYAREAVMALLNFSFHKIKLKRVVASIFSFNVRSNLFLKKLGFRKQYLKIRYTLCKADNKKYLDFWYYLDKTNFIG